MGQPIGLQVLERPAAIGAEIIPADLTNTGLIGEFERGLKNTPVLITSLNEATVRYGGPVSGKYGYYVLKALFENARPFGAKVYVSRVLGSSSAAANTTLTAGTTRFQADTSGTARDLYTVTIETGTLSGSKKFTFKDTAASGPTVTEVYDNILTSAELCDAVNRGIGNGTITYELNGGGPTTTVVASTLVDIPFAGYDLPDNLTETALGSDELEDAPIAAATDPVFSAGQRGEADHGTWGNDLRLTITASSGAEYQRDVTIYEVVNGQLSSLETWINLAPGDFETKLNSIDEGSRYIAVTTTGDLPDPVTEDPLTGGNDGGATSTSDYQGVQGQGTGLYAFDNEDIQLLTHSDTFVTALSNSIEEYCQGRGDVIGISAVAQGASIATIKSSWTPNLVKQKSHLTMYRGWIYADDTLGGRVLMPPTGHVVGCGYIRRMFQHSGLPHTAPAGTDAPLSNALELEFRSLSDTDLEDVVHDGAVNQIMFLPGRRFIIRTSRTTSSLSSNYSAHIRRSLNYLRRTFKDNLTWLEQQPNDPDTRRRAVQVIRAFLIDLYSKGMFEKRGGFDNNVAVVCDETNNPIQVVNQRKLVIDITLRFVEIAELVQINLSSTREGLQVEETVV
jgi:hypothetical protein